MFRDGKKLFVYDMSNSNNNKTIEYITSDTKITDISNMKIINEIISNIYTSSLENISDFCYIENNKYVYLNNIIINNIIYYSVNIESLINVASTPAGGIVSFMIGPT